MVQKNLFEFDERDMFSLEKRIKNDGYWPVAGVDEAGRGALAGPVVAAAVIIENPDDLAGVDDSKKLSPEVRSIFFDLIKEKALCIGIGTVSPEEIDSINILQATRRAMLAAVAKLDVEPAYILVDGITPIESRIPQKTVKKGDSLSLSIAAASIIAKVTRDRIMTELGELYPAYGFAGHKGYGSESHMAAIAGNGPSPVHRMTFRGVREHVA